MDSRGLQWAFTPDTTVQITPEGPQHVPSVEVTCLGDSALHKSIPIEGLASFDAVITQFGDSFFSALVVALEKTYKKLEPGLR